MEVDILDEIVSRWLSPERAARRAERAARHAAQRRKEKRQSWMLIVSVAVVSVGVMVADYFWLRLQAKQKHERYHQQRSKLTNGPISMRRTSGKIR